jgi:hypothetical protein
MILYAAMSGLFGLLVLFFGLIFSVRRALWRSRKRHGRLQLGFYPDTGSLGNALHALQAIVSPQTQHAIVQQLKEEVEDDDVTGPDDPIRPLHRQAKKIRRGEQIDDLTTFVER